MRKRGFTLAEIMIVLTVIGILTAILLPTAIHSTPNEDILKFKKSHANLFKVVNELASSGKYYYPGDLRCKPPVSQSDPCDIASIPSQNFKMCLSIGDLMSTKTVDCSTNNSGTAKIYVKTFAGTNGATCASDSAICNMATGKTKLDTICSGITTPKGITTLDGIMWYEANQDSSGLGDPACTDVDCNYVYKVLCLRIGSNSFGYGVRSDGKVLSGAKADEWVDKNIQED